MTDRATPDDELASAAVDGELTPAEAARVEADPALRARRDELARAAEALQAPMDGPTPAERDAAVSAAMAAFSAATPAVVTPIGSRRRLLPLAAAAAVLVAMAVGAMVVRRSDSTTSTAAKATASTTALERSASSALGAAGATAGGATTGATAADSAASGDLGAYSDVDSLAAAVRARLTPSPTSLYATSAVPAAEAAGVTPACAPPAAIPYPSLTARATLAGQPVLVFVGADAQDRTLLVVLDASCSVVAQLAV